MKTVHLAGDKESHTWGVIGEVKIPRHVEAPGQWHKSLSDLLPGDIKTIQFPFDPHEKDLRGLGGMLGCMNDIPIVLKDEIGNRGDDSALVRTGKEQNGIGLLQFI
jgi:hypothetical protein